MIRDRLAKTVSEGKENNIVGWEKERLVTWQEDLDIRKGCFRAQSQEKMHLMKVLKVMQKAQTRHSFTPNTAVCSQLCGQREIQVEGLNVDPCM